MRLLLLFVLSFGLLSASSNLLTQAEIVKGELRLQFAHTIHKRDVKHFTLDVPPRQVFDFSHCKSALSTKTLKRLRKEKIRFSSRSNGALRLVLETKKPYKCFAYKPILTQRSYHIPLPKRLATLLAKPYKKPAKHRSRQQKKRRSKLLPHLRYADRHRELIVIDAGHGGHDSGAVAGGKKEKDLVLQIAKRVEKILKRRGFRVFMTRRTDRFLKLPQRTKIADRRGATVFVSIHANSVPRSKRNKAYGIETFFLQKTRDAKSKRIAARENAAVLKGAGSYLSKKVIVDAVLNGPKIIESNKLAIDVQRHIIGNLRKYYRNVRDGGVRHAPFWVLVGASRPSILIEVGYISHPKERKRLFDPRYQQRLAEGIAAGIESYLRNRMRELGYGEI